MKLLIVDDDPAVVDFFSQVAETLEAGTIDTAGSGEEAMACVINGQYDLITLDIRMPGANGLEILSNGTEHVPTRDYRAHIGTFPGRHVGRDGPLRGRHARKTGEAGNPGPSDTIRKKDEGRTGQGECTRYLQG